MWLSDLVVGRHFDEVDVDEFESRCRDLAMKPYER